MSNSPDSVKGVGAMGKIPLNGVDLVIELAELKRMFPGVTGHAKPAAAFASTGRAP
jgi:hypothetical protein